MGGSVVNGCGGVDQHVSVAGAFAAGASDGMTAERLVPPVRGVWPGRERRGKRRRPAMPTAASAAGARRVRARDRRRCRRPIAIPWCALNWFDTREYLFWLSRTTGVPYRLPTEEERASAAAGSQPGWHRGRTGRESCVVGFNGANAAGPVGCPVVRGGGRSRPAEMSTLLAQHTRFRPRHAAGRSSRLPRRETAGVVGYL